MFLRKKSTIALLVIMTVTVLLIFFQSALPKEASASESEAVGEVVEQIIETVAPNNVTLKEYVTKNIRKIAHFVEFGLLGAETAILVYLAVVFFKSKKSKTESKYEKCKLTLKYAIKSIFFGCLVAFLDESIQILSNRGPSVKDIWIDLCGFSFLYLLSYAVAVIISARSKSKRNTEV